MSSSRTIRDATVSELQGIGLTVFDSRIQNVQQADTRPLVVVTTPTQRDDLDGGAVVATSTVELVIAVFATGNSSQDAVRALEVLEDAIKGALFTSPAWLATFDRVKSCTTERGTEDGAGRFDVVSQISIDLLVTEQFRYDDTTAADLRSVLIHAEVGGVATPDIDRDIDTT